MGERKIRVLVVDDEKIIRDFFKRLLSLLDLEVQGAEDGYKAIELVKKEKFDLYFVDVRMPGLNGLDTYRGIRQVDPEALVVMITGYAVEDILKQAREEGSYGLIRKPFDISQITEVIDKIGIEKTKEPFNILVIDDEEAILNFFAGFLKEKNLKYNIARNKNEALAVVRKEKVNLIFLDLMLKEESGLEAYKEIKEVLPQVNIVLITGYPQKAKELEGKIEIAGCLYKPFEMESILQYVEKAKAKIK
jgi:DNA-binding NtrC family response regulator